MLQQVHSRLHAVKCWRIVLQHRPIANVIWKSIKCREKMFIRFWKYEEFILFIIIRQSLNMKINGLLQSKSICIWGGNWIYLMGIQIKLSTIGIYIIVFDSYICLVLCLKLDDTCTLFSIDICSCWHMDLKIFLHKVFGLFQGFMCMLLLLYLTQANVRKIYNFINMFVKYTLIHRRPIMYLSYFCTGFIPVFSIFLNKHLASVYHVLSIWYGYRDKLANRTNVNSEQNMKAMSIFHRPWIY